MPAKERTEIAVAFSIILLDQSSKFLAGKYLSLGKPVAVVNNFLYFTLVHNRGAAFGILKDKLAFFIVTSILAVILICFNLKKNKHQPVIYVLSLNLILAGGLGNLIDRIFHGYVVDFIDFRIWPVFNIADSAITIGAILLGWTILIAKRA